MLNLPDLARVALTLPKSHYKPATILLQKVLRTMQDNPGNMEAIYAETCRMVQLLPVCYPTYNAQDAQLKAFRHFTRISLKPSSIDGIVWLQAVTSTGGSAHNIDHYSDLEQRDRQKLSIPISLTSNNLAAEIYFNVCIPRKHYQQIYDLLNFHQNLPYGKFYHDLNISA